MACFFVEKFIRTVGYAVTIAAALLGVCDAQPSVLSLGEEWDPAAAAQGATTHGLLDDEGRSAVLTARTVRFDAAVLETAIESERRGTPAELIIELGPGVVVRSRAAWTERRAEKRLTWSGSVEGDALGQVLLTLERGVVVGRVVADGRVYEVRATGGRQELYEVDPEAGATCGTTGGPAGALERFVPPVSSVMPPEGRGATPDTIGVLMLYSSATREALGVELNAFLQSLLDTANDHFIRSEAAGRIAYTDTREVSVPVSGSTLRTLLHLTDEDDGVLDEVHEWRQETEADLVTLLFEGGDWCGVGHIPPAVGDLRQGFNILRWNCSQVLPNFAHELGHNLGLRHDAYVDMLPDPFPYGRGYVSTEAGQPFRTVMAYDDACAASGVACPAVHYFSTPALTLQGEPLGEPERADAVRALGHMVPVVSAYSSILANTPVAPDFHRSILEDTALDIALPEQGEGSDYMRFGSIQRRPRHGTVAVRGGDLLTYTPDRNYFGPDSFRYRVENVLAPVALWREGAVRVEVEPVPDPPYPVAITHPGDLAVVVSPDSGSVRIAWSTLRSPDYPDGDAPLVATWELYPFYEDSETPALARFVGAAEEFHVAMPVLDSLMASYGVKPPHGTLFAHRIIVELEGDIEADGLGRAVGPTKVLRLLRGGDPLGEEGPSGEELPGDEDEDPGGVTPAPGVPLLYAAYPNPTRRELHLELGNPTDGVVSVALYDVSGREVLAVSRTLEAGTNVVRLDLRALPAGAYVYQVRFRGTPASLRGRIVVL